MTETPNNHTLTQSQFDELAAGHGDRDGIEVLLAGQQSRWIMALKTLLSSVDDSRLDEPLALATRAQAANSAAFSQVVRYAQVQLWMYRCLDSVIGMVDAEKVDVHLAHFASIAAAMAIRSNLDDFSIGVPLRGGHVHLPSIGRAVLHSTPIDGTATVMTSNGAYVIRHGTKSVAVEMPREASEVVPPDSREIPRWEPLRRLSSTKEGMTLEVIVDDIDPYRGLHTEWAPPCERLLPEELNKWRETLDASWATLARDHPDFAESVVPLVNSIVPIIDPLYVRSHGSSNGVGGGAFSDHFSPQWLAFGLLDVSQTAKFYAIHDLLPLHKDTVGAKAFYAPYHDAPVSLSELFSGAYRHPHGIAFWDAERDRATDQMAMTTAAVQYARWQGRAAHICNTLEQSDEITDWGRRVIEALRLHLETWALRPVKVPQDCRNLARMADLDHRISWRLRNVTPDSQTIRTLADAWMATAPLPLTNITNSVTYGLGLQRRKSREILGTLQIGDPETFDTIYEDHGILDTLAPGATDADLLLIVGRIEDSIYAFSREIESNPLDAEPWAGLAVAFSMLYDPAGSSAVVRCPELVHAVHKALWRRYQHFANPVMLSSALEAISGRVDEVFFHP